MVFNERNCVFKIILTKKQQHYLLKKNKLKFILYQYLLMNQNKMQRVRSMGLINLPEETLETVQNHKKKNRKVIGNYSYHMDHLIGWGYTSKVYKGKKNNETIPTPKAIKKIQITDLDDLHLNLLQNEVKIVKKLNHPNIVECSDVIYTKSNCYIMMQLCDGGSLEKHLKTLSSVEQKLKIISDIIAGFKYLVSKGIVHRDMKPGNILKGSNGDWKIADFGFATDIAQAVKDDKISVGTPIYMAPQSLKYRKYSHESDIFGMGLVIYQIINNGKLLWMEKNKKKIYEAIISYNMDQIEVPQPFNKKFVQAMLNVNSSQRPQIDNITIANFLSSSGKAKYLSRKQIINTICYNCSLNENKFMKLIYLLQYLQSENLEEFKYGQELTNAINNQYAFLNQISRQNDRMNFSKLSVRCICEDGGKKKTGIKVTSSSGNISPNSTIFFAETISLIKHFINQLKISQSSSIAFTRSSKNILMPSKFQNENRHLLTLKQNLKQYQSILQHLCQEQQNPQAQTQPSLKKIVSEGNLRATLSKFRTSFE